MYLYFGRELQEEIKTQQLITLGACMYSTDIGDFSIVELDE